MAEITPQLESALHGLPQELRHSDDPRGHWLQVLEQCRSAAVRYPDESELIAYLARGIADATTSRPDEQSLQDRLQKTTGAPKRWIKDLILERGRQLYAEQQAAEAEAEASRPPLTPEELEAQRQAEEAKRQARTDAAPFRVLGWDAQRQKIHYQHRVTAQIGSFNPGPSHERLLRLGSIDYWESAYPADRRSGGVDWSRAVSDLAEAADRAGVFDPKRIRGRGVWSDRDRIVWHLGDRLEVDGAEMPLASLNSENHYPRLAALAIDTTTDPLSDEQGEQILRVIKRMGWAGPSDHLLLAGWIVLSNVGGALPKRPGLQITSGYGTGKSDTADNVIRPLQGGLGITCSGSTEAGIRQTIRQDVLPVVVDESEQADGNRREQQLRLLRLSYDGQPLMKGTPTGDALEFTLRSSIALVGINAPIANPADLSRIAVIGRRQLPDADWKQLAAERGELLTVEAGQALIRRTVSHLPTLLKNIKVMGGVLAGMTPGRGGGRFGDTYGALLAGCHLLSSTSQLDPDAALVWLDAVGWDPGAPAADEVDRSPTAEARQCLDHLLSHELPWRDPDSDRASTGRITVAELVRLTVEKSASEGIAALGRIGLRADPERGLMVANSGAGIEKVFGGTKWSQGGHRARLRELDGVQPCGTQRFGVVSAGRSSAVPWYQLGLDIDPAVLRAAAAAQRLKNAA